MPSLIFLIVIILAVMSVAIWQRRTVEIIYPPMVGLLYRDGRFERELLPGRYTWFGLLKRVKVVKISLGTLPVPLPEITVLSKDQFSFRLALSPVMTVIDARRFSESQPIAEPHSLGHFLATIGTHPALHPSLAAATLEVAGERTLTETMAASADVLAAIQAKVADAVPGATIERVLLTAINLPPETRKMFTDVERSKMEALSALERARGEQAALRVLANAARLVTDNPALANLRLLQAIESSKGSSTIIFGEGAVLPTGLARRPGSPAV